MVCPCTGKESCDCGASCNCTKTTCPCPKCKDSWVDVFFCGGLLPGFRSPICSSLQTVSTVLLRLSFAEEIPFVLSNDSVQVWLRGQLRLRRAVCVLQKEVSTWQVYMQFVLRTANTSCLEVDMHAFEILDWFSRNFDFLCVMPQLNCIGVVFPNFHPHIPATCWCWCECKAYDAWVRSQFIDHFIQSWNRLKYLESLNGWLACCACGIRQGSPISCIPCSVRAEIQFASWPMIGEISNCHHAREATLFPLETYWLKTQSCAVLSKLWAAINSSVARKPGQDVLCTFAALNTAPSTKEWDLP